MRPKYFDFESARILQIGGITVNSPFESVSREAMNRPLRPRDNLTNSLFVFCSPDYKTRLLHYLNV